MARIFEFSDEEMQLIEWWYLAAAAESKSGSGEKAENDKLKALLKKLNFETHYRDQYIFDDEN